MWSLDPLQLLNVVHEECHSVRNSYRRKRAKADEDLVISVFHLKRKPSSPITFWLFLPGPLTVRAALPLNEAFVVQGNILWFIASSCHLTMKWVSKVYQLSTGETGFFFGCLLSQKYLSNLTVKIGTQIALNAFDKWASLLALVWSENYQTLFIFIEHKDISHHCFPSLWFTVSEDNLVVFEWVPDNFRISLELF